MEVYEAKWTAASRKAHKAKGGYFAGPDETYPLEDCSDVNDAYRLAGHAADPDQIRANVKRWAKDNGCTASLPTTAKEESGECSCSTALTESVGMSPLLFRPDVSGSIPESLAQVASSTIKPRAKIATLRVCFLEYNARSLNGRIYPKATCDAIYASAVRKLADTNALPMTVFVSHEAANGNANTELVGRVSRIWQEGTKFYADLDLADTRVAWDMLALAENKSMRSESMRVLGVKLMHDDRFDLPLVVPEDGYEPELLGIDLTTRPGLMDTARIQQVLYESARSTTNSDSFAIAESFPLLSEVQIEKQEASMPQTPLYLQVLLGSVQESALGDAKKAHKRIHDHLAGVMDSAIKPVHGEESARLVAAVESQLDEAGKAIAQQHAVRLAKAHDEAARQTGMDCEGAYNSALNIPDDGDTDGDGDDPAHGIDPDNDGESAHQKGNKQLTEEEMIAALKAVGYDVPAKKTSEQLLQEQFDAKLAAQKQEFEERLKALGVVSEQAPQRKTEALGTGLEESALQPEEMYQEGDYLKGTLKPANWKALSDRRVPWPTDLDPKTALHELAPFMAFRMLNQEANAAGRSIDQYIGQNEIV